MTIITETWHGTINGYKRRGCRCERCRNAYSSYQRKYRDANRVQLSAAKRAQYAMNRESILAKHREYRVENREHVQKVSRRWAEENRHRISETVRLTRYGMTPERFDALLVRQDGRCAVCGDEFTDKPPHIDHDHACCPGYKSCGECIRGLLCRKCNTALGLFKDDPKRMQNAIDYLAVER